MIKSVTVIGAGLMGSGIAAHISNSGINVLLLDVPNNQDKNKNLNADNALKKLIKMKPSPLTLASNIKNIKTGNIVDHLHLINDTDWVIEAIIENIEIKTNLYEKIEELMKDDLIISSNTSTIPLGQLTKNRNSKFKSNFFITHFFNPPRYLRLLELVSSPDNCNQMLKQTITDFCDYNLGKVVINCNDTPGFIGNRIGVHWMINAAIEAINQGLTVEEADLIISTIFGAPKTGVFGLLDVVGLDLIPHVLLSMLSYVDDEDEYKNFSELPEIFNYMIKNNLIGRKGSGGFYKLELNGRKKVKKSIDFNTKEYSLSKKPIIESLAVSKKDIRQFLDKDDKYSKYGWSVLSSTIEYTLRHAKEIASDLVSIDNAMRNGFALKIGPFELMDNLGKDWLISKLLSEQKDTPDILNSLEGETFYKVKNNEINYFDYFKNSFKPIKRPNGIILLSDIRKTSQPINEIATASLWDIGDNVLLFEIHSRGNSIDINTMKFLNNAIDIVSSSYKSMVIYNEGALFSAGANVGEALLLGNIGLEDELVDNIVEYGQKVFKRLKYSNFPVVCKKNKYT